MPLSKYFEFIRIYFIEKGECTNAYLAFALGLCYGC